MEYKAKAMKITSNKNHTGFEGKIIAKSSDYNKCCNFCYVEAHSTAKSSVYDFPYVVIGKHFQ